MFSLLRPRNRERRSNSKTPSPVAVRRPLLQDSNGRVVEDREGEEEIYDEEMTYDDDEEDDEDDMETPLLPIFASEHLGMNLSPADAPESNMPAEGTIVRHEEYNAGTDRDMGRSECQLRRARPPRLAVRDLRRLGRS